MARAKRTVRADARRRYRAATALESQAVSEPGDTPGVPAAALGRDQREPRGPSLAQPPGAQRPDLLGSLRSAASPADVRSDLRALPSLLRSMAGWLPALIVVVTAAAMLTPGLQTNSLVMLAGNVILQPPPMIMAFLAGMLAPRGAWLLGGLASLLSGIAFIAVVTTNTNAIVTPLGFTYVVSSDQKTAYALNVLLTTPVFGIAVGAFAGFYRRFLNLSTPQDQAARRR